MAVPTVSVVLPALDEAAGIVEAIDDAEVALDDLKNRAVIGDYEILVIDDGSTDDTGRLAEARAAGRDRVRVLSHRVNRGVGAGLRTAMVASRCTLVLYTDADMPVDLRAMESAIPVLGRPGVGMVAGQRSEWRRGGGLRGAASKAYDVLARVVLGVHERDVNFPFKLLDREVALGLHLRSDGALIDVEMLARVKQVGLAVEQVTLDYRPRAHGESKTMTTRLLRRLAWELARNGASIRRAAAGPRDQPGG